MKKRALSSVYADYFRLGQDMAPYRRLQGDLHNAIFQVEHYVNSIQAETVAIGARQGTGAEVAQLKHLVHSLLAPIGKVILGGDGLG